MVPATAHANDLPIEANGPPIEPADPSGPATADATDSPIKLLALPRNVLATIVSKLGHRAARVLASTSTTSLRAVPESQRGLRAFTVAPTLLRCMSRMSDGAAPERSVLRIVVQAPPHGECVMYAPLQGMTLLCSGLYSTHEDLPPALHAVPAGAFAGVTKLECPIIECPIEWLGVLAPSAHDAPVPTPFAAPVDMCALAKIDASNCKAFSALPRSSALALRCLHAHSTSLRSLPADMSALSELDVGHCALLDPNFLPESSGRTLELLNARWSNLKRLPEGMAALTTMNINGCRNLAEDGWLPPNSCRSAGR